MPTAAPQGRPQRQTALDLLRLASALMVVVFHFGFRMAISGEGGGIAFPELAPVAMWCDAGLLIFFAISGYVIALSARGRSATDFAVGRFARLWPAFVVCASITALVTFFYPVPGIPRPTALQWVAQFAVISRVLGQPFMDGAYWTIAYEITFYAWVALFLWLGLFAERWRSLLLVWLLVSIGNETVLGSGILRKVLITEYSGFFAFGVALSMGRGTRSSPRDWRTLALLLLAAGWATLSRVIGDANFETLYGFARNPAVLALITPAALALVALVAHLGRAPIPERLAVALGALTYPLYLLHQHIGYAAFAHAATPATRWAVFGGVLVALLAAAHLVASYIEPPARRAILGLWARLRAGFATMDGPATRGERA